MALNSILKNVVSSRSSKLIFDLDSTLFNLDERNLAIFKDAAEHFKGSFPEEALLLSKLQSKHLFYDLMLTLQIVGVKDPIFIDKLMQFWSECFFSNEYLKFDSPEEGARDFILEAQLHGAEVVYLTGRDEPRMFQGTVNSLSEHGFLDLHKKPKLILKPHKDILDHDFKVEVIEPLSKSVEYSCLIDNEPMNLKLAESCFPNVDLVYFESIHTGQTEPQHYWKKVNNFTSWKPVKSVNTQTALSLDI